MNENLLIDIHSKASSDISGTVATSRKRLDLVTPSEDERSFREFIDQNLIGQAEAKQMLVRIHRAAKNPFRNRTRPVYKALMPGHSHTGKTETACVLADYYHGNPEAFIRVNCANYKNKGDLTRLLGAGPQWVGYQKPLSDEELAENKDKFDPSALLSAQNLTASRKGSKTPYTIVLLDEFEKAGEEFEQFFLAIFSAAKERMGNNREVDFSDCIFLMPCNLGMSEITQKQNGSMGFIAAEIDKKRELTDIINRRYPQEVVNRFDEVCFYDKLTKDNIAAVLELHIKKVQQRINNTLGDSAFTVVVEDSARMRLLELCLNDRGDVADLKRVVPRQLTDPISVAVEKGLIGAGDELIVSCQDGKEICFDRAGNGPLQVLDASKLASKSTALEKKATANQPRINAEARALAKQAYRLGAQEKGQAINLLKQALRKLENSKDDIAYVDINNQIGIRLDDRAQAVNYYVNAINTRAKLTLTEARDSIPLGYLYNNLALSLSASERVSVALELLPKAMEQIRRGYEAETKQSLLYFITTYTEIAPNRQKEFIEFASSLMELRPKSPQ